MQIPDYAKQLLAPYYDAALLRQTDVEVRIPQRVASVVRMAHMMGHALAQHWVPIGASPRLGLIQVHPDYWPPRTIEELGLIGHELKHQEQTRNDPNFASDFDWTAAHIPADAPPMANLWEAEAYAKEADIVAQLRAQGVGAMLARNIPMRMALSVAPQIDFASCRCGATIL